MKLKNIGQASPILKLMANLNALCMAKTKNGKIMYNNYAGFRFWFVDKMIEENINFCSLPNIKNKHEFEKRKKEISKQINIKSFKNIPYENLEIQKIKNKATARRLNNEQ